MGCVCFKKRNNRLKCTVYVRLTEPSCVRVLLLASLSFFQAPKNFITFPAGAVDAFDPAQWVPKHPDFRHSVDVCTETTVEPGEILYYPTDWWHQVSFAPQFLFFAFSYCRYNTIIRFFLLYFRRSTWTTKRLDWRHEG
mgnify:CR=1 FL=1